MILGPQNSATLDKIGNFLSFFNFFRKSKTVTCTFLVENAKSNSPVPTLRESLQIRPNVRCSVPRETTNKMPEGLFLILNSELSPLDM